MARALMEPFVSGRQKLKVGETSFILNEKTKGADEFCTVGLYFEGEDNPEQDLCQLLKATLASLQVLPGEAEDWGSLVYVCGGRPGFDSASAPGLVTFQGMLALF